MMQLFLDGSEIEKIKEFNDIGILDGITTNPSIILKSGRSIFDVISEITKVVTGSVSVEVTAMDRQGMYNEGKKLSKIASNITVKLPVTWEGIAACKRLSDEDISVNMTLCFSASQALLAAKARANYISPFIGRLDDSNLDGMNLISEIKEIYTNYGFETKILAASIRNVNHLKYCALHGADVATIPVAVFEKLIKHPLTDSGLEQFTSDWQKTGQSIL
jgi:transaldolase